MSVGRHIAERVGELRAEQTYWEGVRQQACAQLLERANREVADGAAAGAHIDDEREQLRSRVAGALFHLQEIGRKLGEIREILEADVRESSPPDQGLERQEFAQRDDVLKEQLAKQAEQNTEALRKEEQLKADALEKEQRDKEFFGKKESDRLEALAKEEQEKHEGLAEAERDMQEPQQSDLELVASINEEWEYIEQQIAEEWEYVDKQIAAEWGYVIEQIQAEWAYVDQEIEKEMEYNVSQALGAVAEAAFLVGMAIADPVSQKEGKQFLEARSQALDDFVADEVFQGAAADRKEMWLKKKLDEQLKTEAETFGDRKDDLGIRKVAQDGMARLHGIVLEAVNEERRIETKLNDEAAAREKLQAATMARLEKAGMAPEVLEEKLKQLDAIAKKQEQESRQQAEAERQHIWERARAEMRAIVDQTRELAERQDAEKRREAEQKMHDTFGL